MESLRKQLANQIDENATLKRDICIVRKENHALRETVEYLKIHAPALGPKLAKPDNRTQPPIYFKGEHSPFSNFYPCDRLKAFDNEFRSLEHAYQYRQALHYNDEKSAALIKVALDGRAAKRVSKRVFRSPHLADDWNGKRLTVMRELLRAKAEVSEALRTALADSGDSLLVEDVPSQDGFWGRGFRDAGENHLGRLLMELRATVASPFQSRRTPFNMAAGRSAGRGPHYAGGQPKSIWKDSAGGSGGSGPRERITPPEQGILNHGRKRNQPSATAEKKRKFNA